MAAAALRKADKVFNALGDPTRRAIIDRLTRGPSTVTRLAEPLEITITAVRQHLDVLEDCGLVRTQKVGRVRTCRFEAKGLAVLQDWITHHRTVWEERLDQLGDLLAEDD